MNPATVNTGRALPALFLFLLLASFASASVINTTDTYFDMEDFSTYNGTYPYGIDYSDPGSTNPDAYFTITDPFFKTSTSRVDNWGHACTNYVTPPYCGIINAGYGMRTAWWGGSYDATLGFWFKNTGPTGNTTYILDAGDYLNEGFGVIVDQDGYLMLVEGNHVNNNDWIRYNTTDLMDGNWHMIDIVTYSHSYLAPDTTTVYVDAVNTSVLNASGTHLGGMTTVVAHYVLSGTLDASASFDTYTFTGNSSVVPLNTSEGWFSFAIDELAFWPVDLNQSTITQLYNSGYGLNPYSDDPPTQIANILPITLTQQDSENRDFGAYWLGETYIYFNFSYDSANYYADEDEPVDTGDFAIVFDSETSATFYSYTTDVIAFPITVAGCNAAGCTEGVLYFSVGGVAGAGFQQVASVADVGLTPGVSKKQYFSDYFSEITGATLSYIYLDPSDGNYYSITDGQSTNATGCYVVSLSGVIVTYTGLNTTCADGIESYLAGTDEDGITYSNSFTVRNLAEDSTVADTEGVDDSSIASIFLSWLPAAETASLTTKLAFVLLTLLLIIVAGAYAATQGHGTIGAVVMGFASVAALIFYTVIGYLSPWVLALLIITGIGIGVLFARRVISEGA